MVRFSLLALLAARRRRGRVARRRGRAGEGLRRAPEGPERRLRARLRPHRRHLRPRRRRPPRLRARRHQVDLSGLPGALLRRQRQQGRLLEPPLPQPGRVDPDLRPDRGLRRRSARPASRRRTTRPRRRRPPRPCRPRRPRPLRRLRRRRRPASVQLGVGLGCAPRGKRMSVSLTVHKRKGQAKPRVKRVVFYYRKTQPREAGRRPLGPQQAVPPDVADPARAGPAPRLRPRLLQAPGQLEAAPEDRRAPLPSATRHRRAEPAASRRRRR